MVFGNAVKNIPDSCNFAPSEKCFEVDTECVVCLYFNVFLNSYFKNKIIMTETLELHTGIDFALTSDHEAVRDTARAFAENEIAPVAAQFDESQEFPHDIFRQLGELGFLGIMVPTELGGSGMGYMEYALIVEEVAKACPAVALGVAAHNGLGTGHLLKFGSEALKQKYIPQLAGGSTLGAWGLTEPGSGSDASGMLTTAVRDGDGWILGRTLHLRCQTQPWLDRVSGTLLASMGASYRIDDACLALFDRRAHCQSARFALVVLFGHWRYSSQGVTKQTDR
jgi:Acyl-CoA dehydrogenase, N-terminal domain